MTALAAQVVSKVPTRAAPGENLRADEVMSRNLAQRPGTGFVRCPRGRGCWEARRQRTRRCIRPAARGRSPGRTRAVCAPVRFKARIWSAGQAALQGDHDELEGLGGAAQTYEPPAGG